MKSALFFFAMLVAFLATAYAQIDIALPPIIVEQPRGQVYGPPGQMGYGPGYGYGQGGYGGYGGNYGYGKK